MVSWWGCFRVLSGSSSCVRLGCRAWSGLPAPGGERVRDGPSTAGRKFDRTGASASRDAPSSCSCPRCPLARTDTAVTVGRQSCVPSYRMDIWFSLRMCTSCSAGDLDVIPLKPGGRTQPRANDRATVPSPSPICQVSWLASCKDRDHSWACLDGHTAWAQAVAWG